MPYDKSYDSVETIKRDSSVASPMVNNGKAITSHVTLADIGMNNPSSKEVFRGSWDLGECKLLKALEFTK